MFMDRQYDIFERNLINLIKLRQKRSQTRLKKEKREE